MAESAQGHIAGQVNSNVQAIIHGTGSVSSPANQNSKVALTDDKRKIDQLQRQVTELKFNSEKFQGENHELKQEIDITKQKKDKLEKKLAKEKEKREQALTRLSEVAGAKLTENNAAIADLSDIHRPQKLGEMFSEIYDNEWTDAYEELQDTKSFKGSGNEPNIKLITAELLGILYVSIIYVKNTTVERQGCTIRVIVHTKTPEPFSVTIWYCSEQASCLLSNLSVAIRNVGLPNIEESSLPGSSSKKVKDFRKSLGVDLLPRIRELYFKDKELLTPSLSKYTAKCLQFCWYAALQDPPVYIGHQEDNMEVDYDPNFVREYTRKGRFVDFVVWPILFLHEGGALLTKGVVQCKDNDQTRKDSKKTIQEGKDDGPATVNDKKQMPTSSSSEVTPKTTANVKNETNQNAKSSLQVVMPNMESNITPSGIQQPPSVDRQIPSSQDTKHDASINIRDRHLKGESDGRTGNQSLATGQNITQRNDNPTRKASTENVVDKDKTKLINKTCDSNINEIKNKDHAGGQKQNEFSEVLANLKKVSPKMSENKEPGKVYVSKVEVKK